LFKKSSFLMRRRRPLATGSTGRGGMTTEGGGDAMDVSGVGVGRVSCELVGGKECCKVGSDQQWIINA
jgi:hypothetical protein